PGLTSSSITATSLKSPMSGTLTSTRLMGLPSLSFRVLHLHREHVRRCRRIAIELATRRDARFRNFARCLRLGVDRVHRTERKTAPRADAPELLELEHFAIAVQAIDAGRVGNHHAELARLVRIAVFLFRLKEEVVLEIGMQL